MQRLVRRENSLLNPLSGGCLQQPVDGGGGVEDNHRLQVFDIGIVIVIASAFFLHVLSCTRRAVSNWAVTGLRVCRRARNSARVGRLRDLFKFCQ